MYPQQQQASAPRPYGQARPAPLGSGVSLKNGWAFGAGLSMTIMASILLLLVGLIGISGSVGFFAILFLLMAAMAGVGLVAGILSMKEKLAGYIVGIGIASLGAFGNIFSFVQGEGTGAGAIGLTIQLLFIFLWVMAIRRHGELKPLREQAANNLRASRAARRPAGPRRNLNQQPIQQPIQQGYAQPQYQQQPVQQGYEPQYPPPVQPQYQQAPQPQYPQPAPPPQPQYAQPMPQPVSVKPAVSSKQAAMQLFLLAAGLEADHLEARKARALAGVNKAFGDKSGASFTGMLQQLQVNPTGATKIGEYIKPIVNASNDRLPPSIVRVVTYILKDSSVITPVGVDFIKRLEDAIAEGPQEDTVVLHDPAFQQQLQQPPQY